MFDDRSMAIDDPKTRRQPPHVRVRQQTMIAARFWSETDQTKRSVPGWCSSVTARSG